MKHFLTLLAVLFAGAVSSSPAYAAVAYTTLNGGTSIVDPDKSGYDNTTYSPEAKAYWYDYADGYIGANTQITFTYNIGARASGDLVMNGMFDGVDPLSSLFKVNYDPINGKPGPENPGEWMGMIIMQNLSDAPVHFFTYLFSNKGDLSVESDYRAEALAAVPLPAALPIFGLGVVGLAGLKRVRKKQKAA